MTVRHDSKRKCTMSVFGTILEKLGMKPASGGTDAAPRSGGGAKGAAQQPSQPQRQAQAQSTPQQQAAPQRGAGAQMPPPQMPLSETDIAAKLDRLAADSPQKLNWRTSIVDLMKLLGMQSSLEERKELAQELGYPPEGVSDSAKMNIWLHKAVLWEIAKNGARSRRNCWTDFFSSAASPSLVRRISVPRGVVLASTALEFSNRVFLGVQRNLATRGGAESMCVLSASRTRYNRTSAISSATASLTSSLNSALCASVSHWKCSSSSPTSPASAIARFFGAWN
jgi:hypothetical protein